MPLISSSGFPSIPTRHLIAALEDPPEAPVCPDYGFPSLPTSQDRCAHPWIEVYDAPCNDETIDCLLFRSRHYRWRQHRLLMLVSRRPDPSATARAKYDWCSEVLRIIVDLADDTNVAHRFLSGFETPDHFDETRELLGSFHPRYQDEPVPIMFPELWLTGTGSEVIPPRHSALGFHVLSLLGERATLARGTYLWQPAAPAHRKMIAGNVDLEHPRPVRRGLDDRDLSARALSLDIFEHAPNPDQFLVGLVERPTGRAPCMFVGPMARECWHYERFPVAIAGAEVTMDLLEANARDWIRTRFESVVNNGFIRYAKYLVPFAEDGRLALDPDELREHIITTTRREAQAAVGTVTGIASAAANAIPVVGPIISAIIAVVGAVIALLLEVLPMAYGGGGCPVLGFRRMLTDPDCAAPTPQGNPNVAVLLSEYRTGVVARGLRDEEDVDSDAPTDGDTEEGKGGVPVLPLVGAAAVAVTIVAVLAKRKKSRADREARETTEERP